MATEHITPASRRQRLPQAGGSTHDGGEQYTEFYEFGISKCADPG